MHIQWFPGHMTKALREMAETTKKVDLILYILDARCISSSFNPEFNKIISNKKLVYIVNKTDLISLSDLNKWKEKFLEYNLNAIFVSALTKKDKSDILNIIKETSADIVDKYLKKGVRKTIRCMVIGMPNTGKSTIINLLAPKNMVKVADKAGVTRGVQSIRISDYVELYDTPGTLMPAFKNQDIAKKVAFVGSVSESSYDEVELAYELLNFFRENNMLFALTAYGITQFASEIENDFMAVAISRGAIIKGDRIDYRRGAKILLNDFRSKKLGSIILDKAEDFYGING